MGILTFKVDERLKSIVAHAAAAKRHRKAFGQRSAKAALWLVHDAGVYLMSNGEPMQLDPQRQHGTACVVQYAAGCGPDQAGWERSRELVGGDDFAEPLDLDAFQEAVERGVPDIKVEVTPKQIKIYV